MVKKIPFILISRLLLSQFNFLATNKALIDDRIQYEDDLDPVEEDAKLNSAALLRLEEKWRESEDTWHRDLKAVNIDVLKIEVR